MHRNELWKICFEQTSVYNNQRGGIVQDGDCILFRPPPKKDWKREYQNALKAQTKIRLTRSSSEENNPNYAKDLNDLSKLKKVCFRDINDSLFFKPNESKQLPTTTTSTQTRNATPPSTSNSNPHHPLLRCLFCE